MPASVMNAVPFGRTVRVRRLHVRMRPDHDGDPSVQPARHRGLLAGRLRVHVDEHDRRLAPSLLDELVDHLEHGGRRVEEEGSEYVDDAEATAARGRDDDHAAPRRVAGRVRGSHDSVRRLQVRTDLGASKRVVSERDRVGAEPEDLVGEARRDADPVREVLAVDDARVDSELRAQRAQPVHERAPAGGAYDVGDEQDPQSGPEVSRDAAAKRQVRRSATARRGSRTGIPGWRRCCRRRRRTSPAPDSRSG